ncbi:MAG: hypothetical protein KTR31_36055 [Myxococcales bacterium]|nr:hypothetical protein [Myxococcales bacterium]
MTSTVQQQVLSLPEYWQLEADSDQRHEFVHGVAQAFRDALHGPFRGTFAAVTFAILDWSGKRRFLGPFAQAFGVRAS